jgi:hypothetical protein
MRSIGFPELLVIMVVGGLFLVPAIFYLMSLQRALEQCAPASRTMSPGMVWLMLIPVFSLVWHFLVVTNISKSLHNKFSRRTLASPESEPGKTVGLAMCILAATSVIPILGFATGIACLVCWIVYWVKIAGYSRTLRLSLRPA